jgi:hypothetical protein
MESKKAGCARDGTARAGAAGFNIAVPYRAAIPLTRISKADLLRKSGKSDLPLKGGGGKRERGRHSG